MTDDQKRPDVNQLLRASRNLNRVHWTPSTSPDPAERRKDRDALNSAIRRAGGHDPQHTEEEPEESMAGTYPWKSLTSREDDT